MNGMVTLQLADAMVADRIRRAESRRRHESVMPVIPVRRAVRLRARIAVALPRKA